MKRRKDNNHLKTIMMSFVAFIMITSILGFVWKGGTTRVDYNGFPIMQEEVGWSLNFNKQILFFNYHPTELEYLNVSPDIPPRLRTLEIDATSDLEDPYAEQIAKAEFDMANTLQGFDIYLVPGFSAKNEFNKPIITCSNATLYVPVIYFRKSNETSITLRDNCIIAEAFRGEDFIRIKDWMVYATLGIIQ